MTKPGKPDLSARPRKCADTEVSEVADGLVIYQDVPERVHYLNNTAALVYELCTGENTEGAIAQLLGNAFGLDKAPVAEVRTCLTALQRDGVIS